MNTVCIDPDLLRALQHAAGALLRATDRSKDQSYFLFAMSREALASVEFPLGGWTKQLVRAKARALGLPAADAPDSQELCFVPEGDHGDIVEAQVDDVRIRRP